MTCAPVDRGWSVGCKECFCLFVLRAAAGAAMLLLTQTACPIDVWAKTNRHKSALSGHVVNTAAFVHLCVCAVSVRCTCVCREVY